MEVNRDSGFRQFNSKGVVVDCVRPAEAPPSQVSSEQATPQRRRIYRRNREEGWLAPFERVWEESSED